MSQTKAQLIDNLVSPITGALGSASAPTFSFTADPNTGLYSPGADQVAISTAGSGRLFINSSGQVGVGASPTQLFQVGAFGGSDSNLQFAASTTGASNILFGDGSSGADFYRGFIKYNHATDSLELFASSYSTITTNGSERLRVDSSGRLLVGTSSARTIGTGNFHIQSEGSGSIVGMSTTRNDNNTAGSNLRFVKTRGTAAGSTTIVQSGDDLGNVSWWGTDGTNAVEAAAITAKVDGTPGANDMPGRLVFSTTADGAASPTERLRITSAGRVGIGISSPQNALHAYHATDNGVLRIESGDEYVHIEFKDPTTTNIPYIGAQGDNLRMITGGAAAVTIDSSQRVGIGTTSPGMKLTINDTTTAQIQLGYNDSIYGRIGRNSSGNYEFSSYENGGNLLFGTTGTTGSTTERARIDSSGRLLVGTSTSVSTSDTFTPSVQVAGTGTLAAMSVQRYAANTSCPYIILQKSRSGTIGSQAIVNSGDILGAVAFEGSDGSAFQKGAEISAQVDGTPGAGDMPGRLVFSTTADGASTPTERMRINNGGQVLIGTTSTTGLSTGSSVNQGVTINAGIVSSQRNDTSNNYWAKATGYTAGDFTAHFVNNTYVGGISTNGSTTTYATASDYRLKENIVPLTGAIDRINDLQVHRFNFITNPDYTVDGFIAHEAQAVVPECVTKTKDAVDDDGNPVYQGIDQSKLVPLLTAALQEAVAKIESLEARLTAAGI
jgi:hypothetical protein